MSAATIECKREYGTCRSNSQHVPRVSPFLVWGFERFLTRGFGFRGGYVGRQFHSIGLAVDSMALFPVDRPHVFYLNHSSWWDPIVAFLLACHLVPGRHPYAPIEQRALDRYPLLDRTGLFGVDRSPRGSLAFLKTSQAVLSRRDASLWLTPEGRFVDPHSRPIKFEPGIGHLAARVDGWFVPVAIHYCFWTERLPEVLVRIGDPVETSEANCEASEWKCRLENGLATTLDQLSKQVASRDRSQFRTLLKGNAGVGAVYDAARRLRSFARGTRFSEEHASDEFGVRL